ncbi:hypothetical protein [Streptomyces niveus]
MPKSTRIRTLAAPAAGLMLASILSLGAGSTASAAEAGAQARPTGCSYEVPGDWGTVARCTNANGGSYAAHAICKDRETGKLTSHLGGWRQTGFSYAYCQGNSVAQSAGIMTRVTP